jgi:hypothetical protein
MNDKNIVKNIDDVNLNSYLSILDKITKLQEPKSSNQFIKITFCIVGGIISIIFSISLCFMIYKNNFSIESILTVLLAFFSIFISVFFYFKADEASSKFYDSTYNFMKDVSITLGKIEERFGEKLNNMNEKLTHIESVKQQTKVELQSAEDEKDKLINDLLEKADMSKEQKEQYKQAFIEKDSETEYLKKRLLTMERYKNSNNNDYNIPNISEQVLIQTFLRELTDSEKNRLLNEGRLRSGREYIVNMGMSTGMIDEDRKLTDFGKMLIIDNQRNEVINNRNE